ncbi:MAG: sialate O-acetylesterase [Planctomycetaceae bacterium]
MGARDEQSPRATWPWEASTDKSETQKLELLHQPDTIHLNEVGQLAMAWAILKGLGAPAEVSSATLDATSGKVVDASGCRVSNIRPTNLGLEFTRLDERLPFNNGLFYALNYQFVPVPQELNRYMLSVKNLASGQYRLTVAGRDVGRFTAKNLDSGVNISSSTGDPWQPGGPWDAQASVLKSITDARHSAATGIQSSSDWLADSDLAAELSNQASPVNHQLERMQKTIAKPWPYRYVLTGVVDKPGENTDAKIMIESPLEYQVFQRFQKTAGRVVVRGTAEPGAERVQARVRGRAVDGELSGEWRDISFTEDSNRFEEVLTLPAGGWYALDVQAMKGEQSLGHSTVAKFGVGEVFAGAGQSNSTNSGQFRTKQTSGMVASFGGEHWQLADDPQPGVADKTEGGSFWPAFGDALYAKYKVPIGVATTGYGGTSVNAWQPDTGLFDWTMTRIRQLGPGGFRALLWHQGESDVDMTSDEYYTKLKTVIAATKQEAGWGFPWFIAQASYHSQDQPSFASVRTAQAQLWADGIAFRGPDTDTLTGDHRDSDGLGIHFSPKGLKAHGEMWAQIVAEYVDQQLDE